MLTRKEILEKCKKYQEKHRDKIKAYNKKYMPIYYKIHREELLKRIKANQKKTRSVKIEV